MLRVDREEGRRDVEEEERYLCILSEIMSQWVKERRGEKDGGHMDGWGG